MKNLLHISLVLVLGLALAACDSASPDATVSQPGIFKLNMSGQELGKNFDDNLRAGFFTVCKVAEADPTATFEFEGSVASPRTSSTGDLDPIFLKHEECIDYWEPGPAGSTGNPDTVTVTELVPAGWVNDGITAYTYNALTDETVVVESEGPTYSGLVQRVKIGTLVIFHNSIAPMGGEGCTPGAWKNRLVRIDAWDATAYATSDLVNDVFDAPAVFDGVTLLEALSLKGGNSFDEKVEILLRAATAALLNASHPGVEYDLTPAQVIEQVNAAIATGDNTAVTDLATILDDLNNQGCDITNG